SSQKDSQKDQNAKNAAMENSCVATESGGVVGNATRKVTGLFRKLKQENNLPGDVPITLGGSPICNARSQEERLLLTGLMMDRTPLSAAKGVDFAQIALKRKRTLEAKITALDRVVNGLGSGNPSATEVLITEASNESEELAKALDALVKSNGLDEVAKD